MCGCGLIVFVLYYHVPVSCRTDVTVSVPQVRLFACVASDKMSIRSGRDVVVALCQQMVCTSKPEECYPVSIGSLCSPQLML